MQAWIPAVLWFIVLVVVPATAQVALRPVLDAKRVDAPSRRVDRHGHRVWQRQDADPHNYTDHGKQLLRIMKMLQVLQVLGFLIWGSIFIL